MSNHVSLLPLCVKGGATWHIFELLRDNAQDGRCVMSYEEMAELTEYSAMTAKRVVRQLVHLRLVHVSKEFGQRRNSYHILAQE